MAREVTGPEWAEQLAAFEKTAFRLECQAAYHEPYEAEPFRKWLAGEEDPADLAYMTDWLSGVRTATAAGRRYERVRVLADPPTDYQRWEMHVARVNAEAGEDIRVLDAAAAAELELGDRDFWLFDNQIATIMEFGPEFLRSIRYDRTNPDDEQVVASCRTIRDRAWSRATPFTEHPALRSA